VALSQFDLSDLLDAVRAGDDVDLIRSSVEMVLHETQHHNAQALSCRPDGRGPKHVAHQPLLSAQRELDARTPGENCGKAPLISPSAQSTRTYGPSSSRRYCITARDLRAARDRLSGRVQAAVR
jgi:hypothetical protein